MYYKRLLILISLVLSVVFLKDLGPNEFLFIHDEVLFLNSSESFNSFYVRNPLDLGSANTSILIVTLLDRLFYFIFYKLGFNLYTTQAFLYFTKLLLSTLLPYWGFKRLTSLYVPEDYNIKHFLISLWYSFNTYSLIYWHGNGFSLTVLICYALAPLALYYLHQAFFEDVFLYKLKAAVAVFFMSFAIYLFLVFVIFVTLYILLSILFINTNLKKLLKNISLFIAAYLPFIALPSLIIYDTFFTSTSTVNSTGGETFGNLNGGLLYPILMWFSWGIYTLWTPRNIFTFHEYFKTFASLASPFMLYGLVIFSALKKRQTSMFFIFLIILMFFIFFIKGNQEPFGQLYVFLIKYVFLFRVFRSPDSKFGFAIIFAISMLLLLSAKHLGKKIFSIVLVLAIFIQCYPLFTGTAIKGENTEFSTDRIISIPDTYKELISFLHKNSKSYGYVMPFPTAEFGSYLLADDIHLGQDLLPKLSPLPFVYINEYSGMYSNTYSKLKDPFKTNDLDVLKEVPIKYLIIRHDLLSKRISMETRKEIESIGTKVFENNDFEVFEIKNFLPIIGATNANNIEYNRISPIKYEVNLKNVKDSQLFFNESFHPSWVLYSKSNTEFLNKTHKEFDGYSNSWTLTADNIKNNLPNTDYQNNSDGSVDLTLTIYFKTQIVFYICLFISLLYLAFTTIVIIMGNYSKARINYA